VSYCGYEFHTGISNMVRYSRLFQDGCSFVPGGGPALVPKCSLGNGSRGMEEGLYVGMASSPQAESPASRQL
jgi:hypothetical protein